MRQVIWAREKRYLDYSSSNSLTQILNLSVDELVETFRKWHQGGELAVMTHVL